MIGVCPSDSCRLLSREEQRVVRIGYYESQYRTRAIPRFLCRSCKRSFSTATFKSCYRQKKRYLNDEIARLLSSCVSQRRVARILEISRTTVERKFRFLSALGKLASLKNLEEKCMQSGKIKQVYFDEMETVEHTNAKPLSIEIAVDDRRKILGFCVSRFPPRTERLAEISLRKYGPRPDERTKGMSLLMEAIKPFVAEDAEFYSDQKLDYPGVLRRHFPKAKHYRYKSRKATIAGQGELKEKGYDPLFPLNHTCAMLRANINRLIRRSWCTTKKIERLLDHLYLYMHYHNTVLTA